MSDAVEVLARAICAEKNAFYGEPPCWQMEDGFTCAACGDDPGCRDLAAAALRAMPLLVADAVKAEREAILDVVDASGQRKWRWVHRATLVDSIRARGGEDSDA